MKYKNITKILASVLLGVIVLSGFSSNTVKAEGSSISFIPVSSIKLGDNLWGKFQYQNAPMGVLPSIGFSKDDGNKFYLMGSGGFFPENQPNGVVKGIFQQSEIGTTYCDVAINIGTVQAKCYEDYDDCHAQKEPVATYPIIIESPVITSNSNDTYYINDSLDFKTDLTNTALTSGKIEDKKSDPTNQEAFTYQAKTEVIEGQTLVSSENSDYSNALSSSEKLTFIGAGTVKIKVTYEPVGLRGSVDGAGMGQTRDDFYVAEEIITINVVGAKETLDNEISNIETLNLQQDKYTVDSWKLFSNALDNAIKVSAKEDATSLDYMDAYEQLKSAKDNLKLVSEETPDVPGNPTTPSQDNPSQNTTPKVTVAPIATKQDTTAVPKTGDEANTMVYVLCILVSVAAIALFAKKKLLTRQ